MSNSQKNDFYELVLLSESKTGRPLLFDSQINDSNDLFIFSESI